VIDAESKSIYRNFRNEILREYRDKQGESQYWHEDDSYYHSALYQKRKQIIFFRRQVRNCLKQIVIAKPELEPIVRRALRIPVSIPLFANQWPWWRTCTQWFVPYRPVWNYIRTQLKQVKTYEGRDYLYTHFYARLLGYRELEYFSPQIDFVLRKLPTPSSDLLTELRSFDPDAVKATYILGLRNLADMKVYANYGWQKSAGWYARLMVTEGIVQTLEELDWLHHERGVRFSSSNKNELQHCVIRKIIRIMSKFGIERQTIATFEHSHYCESDPACLSENLELLTAAGIQDLTRLLATMGRVFLRIKPELWLFLINVVGAKTPEDIQLFKHLLETDKAPSELVVRHLRTLGVGLRELVMYQTLLLKLANHKVENSVPAISAINLLLAEPYSLNLEQISVCIDYIVAPESLDEYLVVLWRHGYGSANAVIAFQSCYGKMSADNLSEWLTVVGSCEKGVSAELVAKWIKQEQQRGYVEDYRYLLSAISIADFSSLKRAHPIVVLGRTMLRYLIEGKSLNSLKALREWYFQKAKGIHELKWWGREDDELFRLLLDDAFQRGNFAYVAHNRSQVDDVLRERMVLLCGIRPHRNKLKDIEQYDALIKIQRPLALEQLMQIIPGMLQDTGGILLRSLLCCTWESLEILQAKVDLFNPMIDKLLVGNGPVEMEPDELAVEAISFVYKTSTEVVRSSWNYALGQETTLNRLVLESSYPMSWQHAIRNLQSSLERSSLVAMMEAKHHAEKFGNSHFDNISYVCKSLQSKRLTHKASDPWSLAAHLGVLFAAAGDDDEILKWRTQGLEQVAEMNEQSVEAFEHIERLDKLFSSSLPDALDKHATHFLARFSSDDAEYFAERLVGKTAIAAMDKGTSSELKLQEAFNQTRVNVLIACQRWISREKAKFQISKDNSSMTVLYAILSKHPVAYFAKHAVNLCSKNKYEMWHEQRHAHLIVFDKSQRQLAGMALVNIEVLPAIHPKRECLIIRAINPIDDMLATHTIDSIVESFLDVAIRIAEMNDLCAVVIPWHNGTHLLSNLRPVEKYLEKHYTKKSESIYSSFGLLNNSTISKDGWRLKPRLINGEFYAYQNRQELVSRLYAIWCGREEQVEAKDNMY
jgi:hypothetical protein